MAWNAKKKKKQEVLTCIWVSDVFLSPTWTRKTFKLYARRSWSRETTHSQHTDGGQMLNLGAPTNHTKPPLAANTAAAYCRQALIWGGLIGFKVFTLIKLNSCDTPLRTFKVGWSKYPKRDRSERHRRGCVWHWGALLYIPHKVHSLL